MPDSDGFADPGGPGRTDGTGASATRTDAVRDPAVPGWQVEHGPLGESLLVPDPVVRSRHARTAGRLGVLVLGAAVLIPIVWPADQLETLVATGAAALAALAIVAVGLRLGLTRPEWLPGDAVVVLRRRTRSRTRQVFVGTGLELIAGLSDGEVVQRLVAVAQERGARPRTVYSGWQDPHAAEALATWLATRSGVPVLDRRHPGR